MSDTPTSRDEAIRHLYGLSLTVADQLNSSSAEDDALEATTLAAFHLIGVTDGDIAAAYKDQDLP